MEECLQGSQGPCACAARWMRPESAEYTHKVNTKQKKQQKRLRSSGTHKKRKKRAAQAKLVNQAKMKHKRGGLACTNSSADAAPTVFTLVNSRSNALLELA